MHMNLKKAAPNIEVVPHRMGSSHNKKDPLDDDFKGSCKRKRSEDGSDGVYYKETLEEKLARLESLEAADLAEYNTAKKKIGKGKLPSGAAMLSLGSFKTKLKSSFVPSSSMPTAPATTEPVTTAPVTTGLESDSAAPAADVANPVAADPAIGSTKKAATPDEDVRLGFNDIWKEGDEETDSDWLSGKGLKFHTTADKAFSMDSKKFKESVQTFDPLGNREANADQDKRRGEMKMEEFRRNRKG